MNEVPTHHETSRSPEPSNQGISELDRLSEEILRTVADCRFISTDGLHFIFGGEKNTLQIKLTKLTREHYLTRPPAQKFLIKNQGRPSLIYSLGRQGARFLKTSYEDPELKSISLRHALMVTNIYVTLLAASSRLAPLSFSYWEREPEMPKFFLPQLKRRFASQPDAAIEIDYKKHDLFYLEAETGKVPATRTNPRQSSFERRIFYYQRLYQLSKEGRYPPFRVLTIIGDNNIKRLNSLRDLCVKADPRDRGGLNIFWFCLEGNVRPEDPSALFFEPFWFLPSDTEGHSLL